MSRATSRRLLGLSCGQPGGSAEILLKAALQAGEQCGARAEVVRVDDLRIPSGSETSERDDAWWLWEKLVDADALVISTPIIARTITGRLKLVCDRLLGPNADAAIVEELLRLERSGAQPAVPFRVDERVLRPRVAGFIAVGGALTSTWRTLALPLLHTITFSMQIAVADQIQFGGAGTPRSIVLEEAVLERAATLGRNVCEQIGRAFEEVEYRGDEPGLCPMCHLDVIVLNGRDVECATCGACGELVVIGGELAVRFGEAGCRTSVLSMHEKRAHFVEIQETAARQARHRDEIEARASAYDTYDRLVRPPA